MAASREEKLQSLKKTLETQADKHKHALDDAKAELNGKLDELKRQNKEMRGKYTHQDKFLKDVRVNMSKNSSEAVEAQTTISALHKFLSDNSYLVTSLANELRTDKNYYQISKKFLEFKKAYDKTLIGLKKRNGKATVLVHSTENAVDVVPKRRPSAPRTNVPKPVKQVKAPSRNFNGSIISRNSSRKSIILNTSTISKTSKQSRQSVASRNSVNSRKSGKGSVGSITRKHAGGNPSNLSFINGKIDKEERGLNKLKADYKKLMFKTEGEMGADPLVKEKINFLAKEIQARSKQLIELRKNQRQAFKSLFNSPDYD